MGTPFSRKNSANARTPTVDYTAARLTVRVAKCKPPKDAASPPTWGDFTLNPNLAVASLVLGSSAGGMSRAKLIVVPGLTAAGTPKLIEDIAAPSHGDRVIVSIADKEPRWAGYCVGGHISVGPDKEAIAVELVGPEWLWGDEARTGAAVPVVGQVRRNAKADDLFIGGTGGGYGQGGTTPRSGLAVFTAEHAVFNPGGHGNMSRGRVAISASDPKFKATVFETPDRKIAGGEMATAWSTPDAVKLLVGWYNDPPTTGIANPTAAVIEAIDAVQLRDVHVDGMGLWGALRAVLSPAWQFAVDPVPSSPSKWAGFALAFFKRGQGAAANFTLNPPGTTLAKAAPSVASLEASKGTARCMNSVDVLGGAYRQVQLHYLGGRTPTLADADKPTALQHGWPASDGETGYYAAPEAATGQVIVDPVTIASRGSAANQEWQDRYVTTGILFPAYAHAFRLFVWNEAGEWANVSTNNADADKPAYGEAGPFAWYAPDLTGIADRAGYADPNADPKADPDPTYCRRRRRLLDTPYPDPTEAVDGWRKVPSTLYVAGVAESAPAAGPDGTLTWVRVPRQYYRVDHERAAIWIVAHDLSTWSPMLEGNADDPDEATIGDARTFATLLHTGRLRMMLEASIECDVALTAHAPRQASSASPLVRRVAVRAERSYTRVLPAPNLVASPSGLSAATIDDSAAALAQAQQVRAATERQDARATVTCEPDWPEQRIGTVVAATAGRQIALRSSEDSTDPGAQIVRVEIDVGTMKWTYATEADHRAKARAARARRRPGRSGKPAAATAHAPTVLSGAPGEVPGTGTVGGLA